MFGTIYRVTNVGNEKSYVGQTTSPLGKRWGQHLSDAQCGRGAVLAKAIRKYGSETFSVESLHICESREELNFVEMFYIHLLSVQGKQGYNITDGGYSRENYITSSETRSRMSKAQKGHVATQATKSKMSAAHKGENNHFYGKKHKEDAKELMSKPKGTYKDITGCVFGRLTAVRPAGYDKKKEAMMWECVCFCENTCIVQGKNLRAGHTKSCGCLATELAKMRFTKFNSKRKVEKCQFQTYQQQHPEVGNP